MAIRDALRKARLLREGKRVDSGPDKGSRNDMQQRHFAVRIYSELLGEDLWLLSDEKMREYLDDALEVYLPGEIKHLSEIEPSSDHLRKIHECKKIFSSSKIVWN
jgi:hypothetical protein